MRYSGKSCAAAKVALTVATIVLVAAAAAATHPGTWTAREDLPAERIFTATAEVNGIVYTIGGWADNQVFGTVFSFDPGSNDWMTKTAMPTPRGQAAAAVVNGKIYVIGGAIDGDFTATNTVEVYDPANNSWEALTDMPVARWSPAAATVDGKIYVIGGGTGDTLGEYSVYSTVYVYDPASDSWDTAADMPTARPGPSASVIDGLIYTAGGALEDEISGALEVYDPVIDTWTVAADMLTAREWVATAAVDHRLYVFGGIVWGDRVVHEVEVFDPSTGEWDLETRMPDQRWGQGIAVVDGTIYQIGGGPTTVQWQSNHVDTYDPNLYTSWTEVAAHLSGAHGSQWRTDVCALNLSGDAANVKFVLHTNIDEVHQEYTIGPSQQKAFADVVGDMGIQGKGLLQIGSDQALRLAGRTFNEGTDGTFGQFCAFQPMDAGFFTGDEVYLIGLRQEEGLFRTNVVLANTGIREAYVFLEFFSCDGTRLGPPLPRLLEPGTFDQIIEPFADEFGAPDMGWGYVKAKILIGAGVRISASVIDSRTNDATTIVAQR